MKTPFQFEQLRKRSLFSKVFGFPNPDMARQAIANILVEKHPNQVHLHVIFNILSEYNIIESRALSVFQQLYSIALSNFLTDEKLDSSEEEYLQSLSLLFRLSPHETDHIIDNCVLPIFQKALQQALVKKDSAEDVERRVDVLKDQLRLDDQRSTAIYTNAARDIAQKKFDDIVSSKRFTPNEDAQLTVIQDTLGVQINFDQAAQSQLERYRLFSEIEGGKMPIILTDIKLQRGEQCHFVAPAEWHELRSQTVRTEYSGITGNYRIAKGVHFRTGSVAVNRIKRDVLVNVDMGQIYITSNRTIFRGEKGNRVILHRNLLAIDLFADAIKLEKPNGKSPFLLIHGDVELAAVLLTTCMT